MSLQQSLLQTLSDGAFHSGTELGGITGCSRSAIWKCVESLRKLGVDIYSVRGKGYRLAQPLTLLDRDKIVRHIDMEQRSSLSQLEVHFDTDSTNARLLELARLTPASGVACLAERQSLGRGRRGREWVSPFGANLYCSLLWRFPHGASHLAGLSLAIAVAVVRALDEMDAKEVQLKWPNDVLFKERKLGGLLIEVVGETSGPCQVVIGVGINTQMPEIQGEEIGQPWTDLRTVLGESVDRNYLAARVLTNLIQVIRGFEEHGLTPYLEEWRLRDAYLGREVSVHLPQDVIHGTMQGVDDSGALLLSRGEKLQRFHSGELSLRLRS
jgi:BirA family biotin operon repressor/biotin-[acetyl-CoA-carboxylase] ligase